jgi:hypothetical protein
MDNVFFFPAWRVNGRRRLYAALFCAVLFCAALPAAAAQNVFALPSWLRPSFVIAGSYEEDGKLQNRADSRLRLNFEDVSEWLDFAIRAQVLDARPADALFADGLTFFGGGIYHPPTGSRLLFGPLEAGGLPARLKNIYARGAPFVSAHSRYAVDLKTEPAASDENDFAVYLAAPPWGWLSLFSAFSVEGEQGRASFTAGARMAFSNRVQVFAEGFYQRSTLAGRAASSWFSATPPLPEREGQLYAGTFRLLSPLVSAAADAAYSETFAFGRGAYWNAALQLGSRPWRFSCAVDATTPRFVDRAGAAPGEGLRVGVKAEWFRPRGELWRVQTTLRGFGAGEEAAFNRSSSTVYYHFPVKKARFFAPSRLSLTASRNAANVKKIADTWSGYAGLNVGSVRTKTSFSLEGRLAGGAHGVFPGEAYGENGGFALGQWKIAEEVAIPFRFFTLRASLGVAREFDEKAEAWKDAEYPFSLSARLLLRGRLTVKFSGSDFLKDGTLAVSWRFSGSL